MEENTNETNNVQIKQEHLIYGIAAALVVIVILIGALVYVMQSGGSASSPDGGITQQLPPGHPPVQEGSVPGPLDPSQIPGNQAPTGGQGQTPNPDQGQQQQQAQPTQ